MVLDMIEMFLMNVLKSALDCSVYADEALLAHVTVGHRETSEGSFVAPLSNPSQRAPPIPVVTNESCLGLFIYHPQSQKCGPAYPLPTPPHAQTNLCIDASAPPKIHDQERSWLPRPHRRVVMGAEIKASGLDRNADAAEGDWGLGGQQKRGWVRETENRPVSRKAHPTNTLHQSPKLPPTQ